MRSGAPVVSTKPPTRSPECRPPLGLPGVLESAHLGLIPPPIRHEANLFIMLLGLALVLVSLPLSRQAVDTYDGTICAGPARCTADPQRYICATLRVMGGRGSGEPRRVIRLQRLAPGAVVASVACNALAAPPRVRPLTLGFCSSWVCDSLGHSNDCRSLSHCCGQWHVGEKQHHHTRTRLGGDVGTQAGTFRNRRSFSGCFGNRLLRKSRNPGAEAWCGELRPVLPCRRDRGSLRSDA